MNRTPHHFIGALALALVAALACDRNAEPDRSPAADTAALPDTAWTVSASTAGPLRLGIPLADATNTLGDPLAVRYDIPGSRCGYARPASFPEGASLMVVNDTIVRIDVVRGGTAPTTEGARIGDSEDRLREIYGARLSVQPHKYTTGHYLIVTPAAPRDSAFRIVFETDGSVVTRYRAGRRPEVEWIEGCA